MSNELTLFLDAMYTQDSLEHHGVKGMHWGKWNEETRRRRLGISYSNKILKDIDRGIDKGIIEKKIANRIGDARSPETVAALRELRSSASKYSKEMILPENTKEYNTASREATDKYLKKAISELGHKPDDREYDMMREAIQADEGHKAGMKAFAKAYPQQAILDKKHDMLASKYVKLLEKDVDDILEVEGLSESNKRKMRPILRQTLDNIDKYTNNNSNTSNTKSTSYLKTLAKDIKDGWNEGVAEGKREMAKKRQKQVNPQIAQQMILNQAYLNQQMTDNAVRTHQQFMDQAQQVMITQQMTNLNTMHMMGF